MKKTALRLTTIVLAVVLLISFAIIPAAASSDFYESTYNYYYYSCSSDFDEFICAASMYYADSSIRLLVSIDGSYINMQTLIPYDFVITNRGYSTCSTSFSRSTPEFIYIADYSYSIGFTGVYSIQLES